MGKGVLHTVVETPEFRRAAKASGLAATELERIIDHLARRPDAGELIPGTGGARKVRFRGRGHGTSGGYRVVTAWADTRTPVFLLAVFAKGDRIDLTPVERNELRDLIQQITRAYRERKSGRKQ